MFRKIKFILLSYKEFLEYALAFPAKYSQEENLSQ